MIEKTCEIEVDGQPCGEECHRQSWNTCSKHLFQQRTLYLFYKEEEVEGREEYYRSKHEETESGSISRCEMAYNHYTAACVGRELTTKIFYKDDKDEDHLDWEDRLKNRRKALTPVHGRYLMHRKNTDQEFSDRLETALSTLTPPELEDDSLEWENARKKGRKILWEALAGLQGIVITKDESPRETTKYEPEISEEDWLNQSHEHWSNQINKDWSKQSDDSGGDWSEGPELSNAEIKRLGY